MALMTTTTAAVICRWSNEAEVIGMLSIGDLVRAVLEEQQQAILGS
jgi:CBS domain-containing protein